jgi:hypothetical protein
MFKSDPHCEIVLARPDLRRRCCGPIHEWLHLRRPRRATGSAKTQATLQAGGGVELALPKHFGAGAEIGALSPIGSWGKSTLGVFSLGGYDHLVEKSRMDPFDLGDIGASIRPSPSGKRRHIDTLPMPLLTTRP